MKLKIIALMLLLGFIFNSDKGNAQAVTKVQNKYTKRQLENMVFMRWGGFKPKWYYILFHNKYRKGPDRRTILQLLPTDLVVGQTKKKSEEEKEDVDELYKMETRDALNRLSETHYYLHFKSLFTNVNRDIDGLLAIAISINTHRDVIQSFKTERERLNNELEIIRAGWLEKGESAAAMEEILNDLRLLKGKLIRLVNLQKIHQKYTNIQS